MEILRKTVSAFLALMLVLTLLPLPALAEEAAPELFVEETAEAAVFAPPVAGYVDEEDNDSMATANYIGLHLGTGCYGDLVAWDPDYYTFNTSAYGTGTFEIMVEVATFYENFTVALLDGNGNTLCYETDEEPYEGGYIIRFSKTVIGGTFYLSVSTMDSSEIGTSYAFTVTVKDGSFACTHPYADSKVTHPTCVDQGYTTYTCVDCGHVWIMNYTDPTGVHTYSDAQDMTCDVCGKKREEISNGGYCGDNVTWKLKDGILTISGTGGMYGYGYDYWAVAVKAPWQEFADTITTVVIENGVTSIGKEAFSNCKALTSVTIPGSVKVISEYAFYDCQKLASVVIPEGVTGIYERAFYGCDALKTITIPKSVGNIGSYAFAYSGLKTIHFLGKPEKINDAAFSGVKATAYYIENQWSYSSRKDYGGTLSWTAYTIKNCPHPAQSVLEAVAPTCTEPGLTQGQCCAACGKIFAAQKEIPAAGHSFGNWSVTKEAACIETGIETRSCAVCGHAENRVLAALGHKEVTDTAVEATCTQPGKTEGKHCVRCGAVTAPQAEIPARNHSWDSGTVTKEPTEEAGGEKTFTCIVCKDTKTEKLPKLEHTHNYTQEITAPTCTKDGYTTYTCACGDSYVSDYVAGGHTLSSWKSDAAHHWLECTVCEAKLDAGNHDGIICTVCGYETPSEPVHEGKPGDVNHDGKINAKDATLILQSSVGVLKNTAKFCETCAEVSGDGKLNAKDSTLILQYSVGLRTSFPAEEK